MSATAPGFPSTLASSRRILVDLWLRHRNQRTLWLGGVLAAVCLALTLAPLLQHGTGARAAQVVAIGAVSGGMLLVVAWLMTVASVLEQNHPVLARTVPGHARRLRAALLTAAGAVLAVVAAGVAGLLAVADVPPSTVVVVPVMAAVSGAAVVLAYVALAVRWPVLWILAWIGPALLGARAPELSRSLAPLLAALAWPPLLAAITLGTLAAGAAVVRSLVQEGGPRHEERHAALCKRSSRTMSGADKGLEQFLPDGQRRRLAGLRDRLFALAVRRELARGRSPAAARAMLAFGPHAHWTAQAGVAAGVGLLVAMQGLALAVVPDSLPLGGIVSGFSVSLVFACSRLALHVRATLHATRGEQALAMLAPGVPRGGVLNRAIGARLAAQFLGCWAFGLGVVQLVQALLRSTSTFGAAGAFVSWPNVTLLLALSQLLLVPELWRRWSRVPPPTPASVFLPVLLPGAVALGGTALVHAGVLSTAAAGTAIVAVAAGRAALRWRRIGAEPSMLPVGRLHR